MSRWPVIGLLLMAGVGTYVQFAPCDPVEVLAEAPPGAARPAGGSLVDVRWTFERPGPVAGHHTVLVFYVDCPSCEALDEHLRTLARLRPDVAIRKVRLTWDLARVFHVEHLPHVVVYDHRGRVLGADRGASMEGLELLLAWIRLERARADAPRPH